jgi:predicted nucleotidyltransferase component of viral defense system
MIDVIKQQFTPQMDQTRKTHLTREMLQIICLKIMNEKKMFERAAFLGGTALRVLYDIRRFSEDLDFSTTGAARFQQDPLKKALTQGFQKYGFTVETTSKNTGAVLSVLIKFQGLLKELGLSGLSSQKLSIKWDIDQNPPEGAATSNTIINKYFMFNVTHYDLASLFAGKLHACFFRTYIKGRDWYDLLWFITRKVTPNFALLNNAIEQTQNKRLAIDETNFKEFMLERIQHVDFDLVKKDVERFLEDKGSLEALNGKFITDTIRQSVGK